MLSGEPPNQFKMPITLDYVRGQLLTSISGQKESFVRDLAKVQHNGRWNVRCRIRQVAGFRRRSLLRLDIVPLYNIVRYSHPSPRVDANIHV